MGHLVDEALVRRNGTPIAPSNLLVGGLSDKELRRGTVEVLEAIHTRRSIRKYKTTSVNDKTLALVLDAARWAPSWRNTQCWRFIVVRDGEVRNILADMLFGIVGKPNIATEGMRSAPVVIVACAELGQAGYLAREPREPITDKGDCWYMFDVALAMQNLLLAAHSLGLGTVLIGGFDAKVVAGMLEVPEGFCVVAMTPLGYPETEGKIRSRRELSEFVFMKNMASGEMLLR